MCNVIMSNVITMLCRNIFLIGINIRAIVLQLNKETTDGTVDEKAKVYQRANKEVESVTLKKKKNHVLSSFSTLNGAFCLPRLL